MTIEYHWDLIQKSDEWFKLKTGVISASQTKLMLSKKLAVSNNDKSRAHVYEIAAQRAVNHIEETYQSWDMQRGNVEEIYAKDLYSKHKAQVKDCGFITNDKLGFIIGASPDGLVGEDGGIEVKSRCQKLQMQAIADDEIPELDMLQVQTNLFVSEREWWDYISYSNGMPMYIKRARPDMDYFTAIRKAFTDFDQDVKEKLALYEKNIQGLIITKRRDHETGEVIKPSKNAENEDLRYAG